MNHMSFNHNAGVSHAAALLCRLVHQHYGGILILSALYCHITMDEHESVQVVELRVSYRYAAAHPWVVQAIGGFLSAYFMEHPGFRVQRYMEELESGTHLWLCETPATMKFPRLLRRLQEDIPPCRAHQQVAADLPARPRYFIDCP
jgi:hypothetical protein